MGESSGLPYEVVTKPQVNFMLKHIYFYYTYIRNNKIVYICRYLAQFLIKHKQ